MIHINVRRIDLARVQPLIDAADQAQREINAEGDPARRKALIERYRPKWVAFREHFANLPTGNKCWYTESRNPGTDDDIDHFRPKGDVAEDANHGGYYWQALTWTNFRLSCHRANRPRVNPNTNETHGKVDHFPLFDEAVRARQPADNLNIERPKLLDPCDPFDPPKLSFNSDGTVAVSPAFENNPDAVEQVEASRKYLHLDWPAFVDDRTTLHNTIYFKIKEGKEHADRTERGDAASRSSLKNIATDLADLMKEDRPYSSAATAYLWIYREIWWVRDVVLKLPPPPQPAQGAA
jgi:hypothetical protein